MKKLALAAAVVWALVGGIGALAALLLSGCGPKPETVEVKGGTYYFSGKMRPKSERMKGAKGAGQE